MVANGRSALLYSTVLLREAKRRRHCIGQSKNGAPHHGLNSVMRLGSVRFALKVGAARPQPKD